MESCTLSRISIRHSASAGVGLVGSLGDGSACNVMEIMNGMSRDSIPILARSS